jgi:hypothetical protein
VELAVSCPAANRACERRKILRTRAAVSLYRGEEGGVVERNGGRREVVRVKQVGHCPRSELSVKS